MSFLRLLALLAACVTPARAQHPLKLLPNPTAAPLVLTGGRVWIDGEFVERTLYIEDGRFSAHPPEGQARVVELGGRHVVPPYADAHVHHFTRADSARSSRDLFVSRGFFYVANLCGPHGAREATAAWTNRPRGVDALFAHGALCGLSGHPVPLYRSLHRRRGLPDETFFAENDDNTFYRVDSAETLREKLGLLLATGPDLVKIIQSRVTLERTKRVKALDPQLVPEIVERVHAAGLPVVAHIDDRADFLHVLGSGVDWLAHTPGFGRRADEPLEPFLLRPRDARAAAEAGLVVITTAGAYDTFRSDNSPAQEAVDANLALLRDAGVTLLFGSDDWEGPETELRALRTHAGFTPLELLYLLCETTPRALFPERDLGHLQPGAEASLLVLAGDPMKDPALLTEIDLIVKQGLVLAERGAEER